MNDLDEVQHAQRTLRHWEMVQHLVWELHTENWPFSHAYPNLVGKQISMLGFSELMDYAKYDPRFIARGLVWEQPPCRWVFEGEDGDRALALFFGIPTSRKAEVRHMLETEAKAGSLRMWVHRQVQRARKVAGLPVLEFTPDARYSHMLQPDQVLRFSEPDWLEQDTLIVG